MYASAERWQEFYRRLRQKALSLTDPATGRVRSDLVTTVSCVACGERSSKTVAEVDGFTYVACQGCGYVYLNPQLRIETLDQAYNDTDVREYFFRELLLPFVENDQVAEFTSRLDRIKTMAGSHRPRLVDIGCAAGKFLQLALEKGFDAEGLELNGEYVEFIRQKRDLNVRRVPLEEAQYEPGSFDAVTMWDVLEHVPDPAGILRESGRILKPGGVLAFTTINHTCFNQRLLGKQWRYWMPPDHVCSFSPAVLRSLLGQAGFRTHTIEHHALFEVMADVVFPWLSSLSRRPAVRVVQKGISLFVGVPYQKILSFAGSGDLLTVYAVKK